MSYKSLLNQEIALYRYTSSDKYGRYSFDESNTVKARMQVGTRTRLLPNSEVMTIDAICFVDSSVSVERGDKISYGGIDYKVSEIKDIIGATGNVHHKEMELQKWL